MSAYLVAIEGEGDSFSAYAPDIPGCVAAGDTADEVRRLMHEAIPLHEDTPRAGAVPRLARLHSGA